MSDLLPALRAAIDAYLEPSLYLTDGLTWEEQRELPKPEQVAMAELLRKRWVRLHDLEHVELVFLSSRVGSLFLMRLATHAYWCAWNLLLDPPRTIDPVIVRTTEKIQPLRESPDQARVLMGVSAGLDRLQFLGYPPKPLKSVVPGRRGRSM